jgi:hypothetical protein
MRLEDCTFGTRPVEKVSIQVDHLKQRHDIVTETQILD